MASRKDNLMGLMKNSRTRVIILITALILVFTMIYGYVHFSSSTSVLNVKSKIRISPNIQSIPGALNQTPEYSSLQNKQNIVQAQKALQTGASAIPTIINVQKFGDGVTEVGPQGGTGGLGFSSLSNLGEGPIKAFWMDDLKKTNCESKSLKTALENGASLTSLKDYCSCKQLMEYGFKLKELNTICDCRKLKSLGLSACDFKSIGYNAGKLRECGYSACEEKAAGFSALDMKNAGFPDAELKGAGFPSSDLAQASGLPYGMSAEEVLKKGCSVEAIKELKAKGVSASAIRRISGCTLDQLKNAGFNVQDLKDAGFTPAELLNAGFSSDELKKSGFSAKDLLEAGLSPEELAAAGYSANDISQAQSELPKNITASDIRQNGCSVDALKKERLAGVSAANIAKFTKCSPAALLKAGFSPEELAEAGYTVKGLPIGSETENIRKAGCDPQKLAALRKAGVKAETIMMISKCSPETLKAAGFSAAELFNGGVTAEQLAKAGFSPEDIKQAQAQTGSETEDIRKAGCDAQKLAALRNAGVKAETIMMISKCSPETLKAAGFTAAELFNGGVTAEQLARAGFSPDDIKQAQAGIKTEDIRKAGCDAQKLAALRSAGVKAETIMMISKCSPDSLKTAGFNAAELLNAGVSPEQLAEAGFSPDEIKQGQVEVDADLANQIKGAGCDPVKLAQLQKQGVTADAIVKANNCDPAVLGKAGFTAKDILNAGFTPEQLLAAGFSPKDIQDAQKSMIDLLAAAQKQGCTPEAAAKAKAQGMTALELRKTLGCSLAALKAAGFSAKELKDAGFTPGELAKAGFTAKELLAAGYTPSELKAAGFTAKELLDAGVTPKDLLAAGVTPDELKKAGVSAKAILAAGATVADLKDAGFSEDELQKAGISSADVANSGLNSKLGALADVADVNLKQDDKPSVSSMLQAGSQTPDVKQNAQKLEKLMTDQKKMQAQTKFQQKIQTRVAGIQAYAQQLMAAWKVSGTQAYVAGTPKVVDKAGTALATGGSSPLVATDKAGAEQASMDSAKPPTIKVGDILFAVVDTSVNSDEPGPLLATITNGTLKGSKLIGSFSAGSSNAEKLTVNFNALSVPWLTKTVSVSAYAIDPNTGRTALSSSTNHHYVERYGALFASTFLEGFGNAFQSADTTITIGGTGVATNTTVENGIDRSLTDNAVIALATVGKAWGQQAQKNMNIPTTIQIYSGTPVAVLFLQDVTIAEK